MCSHCVVHSVVRIFLVTLICLKVFCTDILGYKRKSSQDILRIIWINYFSQSSNTIIKNIPLVVGEKKFIANKLAFQLKLL